MCRYIGQWLGEYWIVWITPSSFLLIYFIVLPRNWITQIKSLQFFRVSSQPFYKPGKVATTTHKALNKILPIGQVAKKNGTKTRWRRDGRIANGSGPGGPTLSTGCTMMHISKHCRDWCTLAWRFYEILAWRFVSKIKHCKVNVTGRLVTSVPHRISQQAVLVCVRGWNREGPCQSSWHGAQLIRFRHFYGCSLSSDASKLLFNISPKKYVSGFVLFHKALRFFRKIPCWLGVHFSHGFWHGSHHQQLRRKGAAFMLAGMFFKDSVRGRRAIALSISVFLDSS